jgi:hypothetical protein
MASRKTLFWMKKAGVLLIGLFLLVSIDSCNNFLDADPPNSKLTSAVVFSDDATATAAIVNIYLNIYQTGGFASGGQSSLSTFSGLSADELRNNPQNDPLYLQFERNDITPVNSYLLGLWTSLYNAIYQANSIIEGLEKSPHVSIAARAQLTGEALFIRAFCHFYLTNTFGDVALVTSTNYTVNRNLGRVGPSVVYEQIKSDLLSAEELLSESYASSGRVRPNRFTASALLARVYLYTQDWARAEDKAMKVLSNTSLYTMLSNPGDVFLQNSSEAIWQLAPPDNSFYTNEGYSFSASQGPQFNVLRNDVLTAFESGDSRKTSWITSTVSAGNTVYLPYKYKKSSQVGITTEYSMVIRLAEVYLIRSEARLQQNKISAAIADLDVIRKRANLPLIQTTNPGISKEDLLQRLIQERRIELMTEWGHRWFDLKRWGIATGVLSAAKPGMTDNDLLYPIPQVELNNNANLKPQNAGY